MEYTIQSLAKLAGISSRTLRYYDQIDLLKPVRISSSSYRIYGAEEVSKLQKIMFYKELEVPLDEIKKIIGDERFDFLSALQEHREKIEAKQRQLELLIKNIDKTLGALKGESQMQDKEKFEGFKQNLLDENEKKYGKEIREKYGEEDAKKSNEKFKNMTKEQLEEVGRFANETHETLRAAMAKGDTGSEEAQKAVELHRRWLSYFGDYTKEMHLGLTEMYVDDSRFTAYYDENVQKGAAEFLRAATKKYYMERIQ